MNTSRFCARASIIICLGLTAVSALTAKESIPHYIMELAINPGRNVIEGSFRIEIPWTGERERDGRLTLVLMMNMSEKRNPFLFPILEDGGPEGFSPGSASVTGVKVNGRETGSRYTSPEQPVRRTFSLDRLLLEVELPESYADREMVTLEFTCTVRLPLEKGMDDFAWGDRMISRFSWFPYLLPAGAEAGTSPDFSMYFFTYEARVSLPPDWQLAAVGTEFTQSSDGSFSARAATPVVSFPLAVLKGHEVLESSLAGERTMLRVYYRKGLEGTARMIGSYAADALAHYRRRFFPTGYGAVSIVQGNPGAYGMAADSLVVLGDAAFAGANRVIPNFIDPLIDYLLAHELAHFYFGIGSPPDFTRENYLSEGLTEYASIAYIEEKYGVWGNFINTSQPEVLSIAARIVLGFRMGLSYRGQKLDSVALTRRAGWERPLSEEESEKILNASSGTDYDKSFFIISMLANRLGREEFDRALTSWLEENRYRAVDSETLRASLETHLGVALGEFFESYVYGNESYDYSVTGRLNAERAGELYRSRLLVGFDGDAQSFIPTTLTAFLQDGSTRLFPVESPGELLIETAGKVAYVGLDADPTILDYDRGNNYHPRQIIFIFRTDYRLKEGGALLWSILPYLDADEELTYLGFSLGIRDRYDWNLSLSPFMGVPPVGTGTGSVPSGSIEPVFGTALSARRSFPGFSTLSLSARVSEPGVIAPLIASYGKTFYRLTELGYVSRYYLPSISLAVAGGIGRLGLTGERDGYLTGAASVLFNSAITSGRLFSLRADTNYHLDDGATEARVSASLEQGFRLLPRTMLAFRLSGSSAFGAIRAFGAGNAVLGLQSTAAPLSPRGIGFEAFLGFSLANDIETPFLNLTVLQSLNGGLVYEAAGAFAQSGSLAHRHAAGLVLFPAFRTLLDLPLIFGLGFSVDLNRITAAPGDPESYRPGFFIELGYLQNLFAMTVAY